MNWRAPIIKTNLHSRSVWIQRCASDRARGRNFNSPYHSWSFHQTHVKTAIYINDNVLINLLNSQLVCLSPKMPVTSQCTNRQFTTSLRSKRLPGAKSEEFARAKTGARAKIRRRGWGAMKETLGAKHCVAWERGVWKHYWRLKFRLSIVNLRYSVRQRTELVIC